MAEATTRAAGCERPSIPRRVTGGTFASSPNPGDAGGSEGGDDGTGTSGGNDGQERPEGEQGEEPSEPEPIQAHVCEPDTFGTDGEPESCTQWKTCLPGEYVSKPGTPTTDRECEPCAEGYSTTENAPSCTAWTHCTWAMGGRVTAGTPTKDAVCGTPNEYRQFAPGGFDAVLGALALDGSENVYLTGGFATVAPMSWAPYDAYLIKLTPDGHVAWKKEFGSSSAELALGLGTDANGNIYVTGYTEGDLDGERTGSADVFIRKYDSLGTLLPWAPRRFGTEGTESVAALKVDVSGNVYVAGRTGGSLGTPNTRGDDVFVRKYQPDGSVAWTAQYGTADSFYPSDLAVDDSGNSYVVGHSSPPESGAGPAFLMKFTATGSHAWTETFRPAEGSSDAHAVALDTNDNVYVAGTSTTGSLPGATGEGSGFVRKYTTGGGHQRTWQFPASVYALALDRDGNVLVAGSVSGVLDGQAGGGSDAYVRKYTPNGELVPWLTQFGTVEYDSAGHLAVDAATGTVYVAGWTSGNLQLPNSDVNEHLFVRQLPP